jgi:ribosomal protein S24E
MDIEGAEYEVLDDILNSGIEIKQLVVEFHHRFATIGEEKTKAAIEKLKAHNYKLFYVSENQKDFGFIKTKI